MRLYAALLCALTAGCPSSFGPDNALVQATTTNTWLPPAFAASVPPNITWLGNVTTRPSVQQLQWHGMEVGVMITFNLQSACTVKGAHNASAQACQAAPLYVPDWDAAASWTLSRLDTDQWAAAAVSMGAQYAVLTVDHMTGFSLWPTRVHNASVAHVAWAGGKGDVVAAFRASCDKFSLAPAAFYSTHYNWVLGMDDYRVGWPRLYGGPALTQAEYEAAAGSQLRELQEGYGPWFEVWFDGGISLADTPSLGPLVRQLFPSALCHSCPGFSEPQPGVPGTGVRWWCVRVRVRVVSAAGLRKRGAGQAGPWPCE